MSRLRLASIAGLLLLGFGCEGGVTGIVITSPEDGQRITGPVEVEIELEGQKSQWYSVTVPGSVGGDGEWPDEPVVWTPTESGEFRVFARTDDKDDQAIWDEVAVTVDLPWNLSLVATDHAFEPGVVEVELEARPELYDEATIFLDDEVFGVVEWNHRLTLDTRLLQDGPHTLRAETTRASDGKPGTADLSISTDNCATMPVTAAGYRDLVAMEDGTLYLAREGIIDRWTPAGGLLDWIYPPAGNLTWMAAGPDGTLFVVEDTGWTDATLWEVDPAIGWFDAIPGAPVDIAGLTVAEDGRIYVATGSELMLWTRADGWSQASADFPGTPDGALFLDSQNRLWSGGAGRQVHKTSLDVNGHATGRESWTLEDGQTVLALGEDDSGRILVLNEAGVHRYDASISLVYHSSLAPLSGPINEVNEYWHSVARMTHVKHRPGCHAILVTGPHGPGLTLSDVGGRP